MRLVVPRIRERVNAVVEFLHFVFEVYQFGSDESYCSFVSTSTVEMIPL